MATVMEQMKGVVAVKADKSTLDEIVTEKANKVDTEMCLRWVDLLHKMVNKVVLLLTTKAAPSVFKEAKVHEEIIPLLPAEEKKQNLACRKRQLVC